MSVFFVILASVLFGCIPTLQEHIMLSGASPLGLVIVCNSVASLAALIAGLIRRESFRLDLKTAVSLLLTGAVGLFFTDFLLNLAYTLLPVGFVTMIHFLYPTLVCLIMAVCFREKLTGGKLGAIVCSAAGLILLSGGSFSGSGKGILVAISTAFAYSFYIVANDRLPVGKIPLMARSFYLNLIVALMALCLNGVTHSAVLPQAAGDLGLSILTGCLISTAVILLNAGIGKLGAAKAGFLNMLEPVISLIVSTMVYHYSVTAAALAGCGLILASLLLITLADQKT